MVRIGKILELQILTLIIRKGYHLQQHNSVSIWYFMVEVQFAKHHYPGRILSGKDCPLFYQFENYIQFRSVFDGDIFIAVGTFLFLWGHFYICGDIFTSVGTLLRLLGHFYVYGDIFIVCGDIFTGPVPVTAIATFGELI